MLKKYTDLKNHNKAEFKKFKYYVYALCEIKNNKKIPFYIGMGKGSRCLDHLFDKTNSKKAIKIQRLLKEKENKLSIDILRHGIETKEIHYQQSFEKLSKEFSITKGHPILLYVGSGFKRKGVKEFLQIIAKLEITNLKAFVIGKEKNIEYYHQLVKELDLESQVIFTGPREDVDDFYAISDIFLFPTHYEPFSNVVLEAMDFENAVFTTKQNGASEILDDYFIMNKPEDFSVASSIKDLLNNKIKLQKIKQENRAKSKQFSIEKNLSETLKVINEIIN